MKVLGIEITSSKLHYVLIEGADEEITVLSSDRLMMGDARSPEALRAFNAAVQTILNGISPDILSIKEKPEAGRMRAGAPAIKMEGILLSNANCAVDFVSGARINACDEDPSLKAYHQLAYKAAVSAYNKAIG